MMAERYPAPMSDLAGVVGEVLSSLLHEDSELVGVGFRVDGDGDVAVSSRSGGRFGGRQAISSIMDLRLGGWYMGMNFLRNFLFLSVCLPADSCIGPENTSSLRHIMSALHLNIVLQQAIHRSLSL